MSFWYHLERKWKYILKCCPYIIQALNIELISFEKICMHACVLGALWHLVRVICLRPHPQKISSEVGSRSFGKFPQGNWKNNRICTKIIMTKTKSTHVTFQNENLICTIKSLGGKSALLSKRILHVCHEWLFVDKYLPVWFSDQNKNKTRTRNDIFSLILNLPMHDLVQCFSKLSLLGWTFVYIMY